MASVLSAIGLSGIVGLLTFLFASRRDRRQRLTQVEISRLEDLRSVLSIFISLIFKKREYEKLAGFLRLGDGDLVENRQIEHEYKKMELDAEISRYFHQVSMLVDLSYQGKASDLLLEAMEKGNVDGIEKFGTLYLNREWARILEGNPPNFSASLDAELIAG